MCIQKHVHVVFHKCTCTLSCLISIPLSLPPPPPPFLPKFFLSHSLTLSPTFSLFISLSFTHYLSLSHSSLIHTFSLPVAVLNLVTSLLTILSNSRSSTQSYFPSPTLTRYNIIICMYMSLHVYLVLRWVLCIHVYTYYGRFSSCP